MKNYILIFVLMSFLEACNSEKESSTPHESDEVVGLTTTHLTKHKENTNVNNKSKSDSKQKEKDSLALSKSNQTDNQALSPQQKLVLSLGKGLKVEYAPLDLQVIKEDTTILSKDQKKFEISYATSCLNDSLIAQEMYDYGGSNSKSYLISHNYKTNLSIKVDGILKGTRIIQKDLFKNKLDKSFLEKSILKHPRFVKFNEETNEAVFEFIVGVPNTDWLVLAGVNLNDAGNIRIIDIVMPPGL